MRIYDAYSKQTTKHTLDHGEVMIWHRSLENSYGWCDLRIIVDGEPGFLQQLAGHVETGRDSGELVASDRATSTG